MDRLMNCKTDSLPPGHCCSLWDPQMAMLKVFHLLPMYRKRRDINSIMTYHWDLIVLKLTRRTILSQIRQRYKLHVIAFRGSWILYSRIIVCSIISHAVCFIAVYKHTETQLGVRYGLWQIR